MSEPTLSANMDALARAARAAARPLAAATTLTKNAVLAHAILALRGPARDAILQANAGDVARARTAGLAPALLDRLTLTPARLDSVAEGLATIARLPDPVGAIDDLRRLPSGLEVGRMRVPIGLICIIYESRPNVTADAAGLCVKSGNAVILRGGKEALASNRALAEVFTAALAAEGLPPAAVTLVPTTDREAARALVGLTGVVDLVIPRGGEELIRFVVEHARVPVIQHYKGVCHVYVDGDADGDMAESIVLDAKTRRPGVCNAMETLLVDRACAPALLPRLAAALTARGVALTGDPAACALVPECAPARAEDWDTEHLALALSVAVVDGLDGALAHIARHGTQHTEAIVTRDWARARRFVRDVDASLVLVNASTRFNDGAELGLGAEMGISTSKLHAYGPMGLEELCTRKWVAFGEGQVRG